MNMSDVEPNYIPRWHCNKCGSYDVQTLEEAWFDPNNSYRFIESIESSNTMDWCNTCNEETTLDECYNHWQDWAEEVNGLRPDKLIKESDNEESDTH